MERADFVFQIFFEQMDLNENVDSEIIIMFRLFQLSSVEVFRNKCSPGTIVINEGKRMMLKIPQVEVVDGCPLEICIRAPRPGHTSVRLAQDKINLGILFEKALQFPNRYVQKKYVTELKGKRDQTFGTMEFSISVCYTSSSMRECEGPPLVLTSSAFNEPKKEKRTISRATATFNRERSPLIPVIPETRKRSIFYFDKGDLLEENRQLAEEITHLTELVQRLHEVVDQYEEPKTRTRAVKTQKEARKPFQTGGRSDFIYHPPGMKRGNTFR